MAGRTFAGFGSLEAGRTSCSLVADTEGSLNQSALVLVGPKGSKADASDLGFPKNSEDGNQAGHDRPLRFLTSRSCQDFPITSFSS